MELERIIIPDGESQVVRGYGDSHILVNNETVTTSAILTPNSLDTSWPPERFEDLEAAHIEVLPHEQPDLVLLGTGHTQRFPAAEVLAPLYHAGIGVEVMDTGAACRTFNIVMSEGRRVVAALLMMHPKSMPN